MAMGRDDTIVALATGALPSALATVRISGTGSFGAVARLMSLELPAPRLAKLRKLKDGSGAPIDEAVVTRFPGPNSFTGEDLCEITVHGGPAVVEHLIASLTDQAGVRLAEPGEFSRRAFELGRLDLTEAEAIADLIAAETRSQKSLALEQLSGSLAAVVGELREDLIDTMAACEVMIDFADEGDAPDDNREQILSLVTSIANRLCSILSDNQAGERLRDGIRIAIIGPPNAGKSTLLNALAQEDAAIVSSTPGTTRDVVRVRVQMADVPVTLFDTAGIRETEDEIEAEGVARAKATAETADLKLVLVPLGDVTPSELKDEIRNADALVIRSKADLADDGSEVEGAVSFVTGQNMPALMADLEARVKALITSSEPAIITRRRHREAFSSAKESLERAKTALESGLEIALVAEDIRRAIYQTERLTGRVDVEDVLGSIFSRFCIGK